MVAEKWMVHSKKADFDGFAKTLGVSPIVARIMRNKDLETIDEQKRFLDNSLENLHNPSLMKDMDKAIDIIINKIEEVKHIRVIGDYDIDGICSTYILVKGLQGVGASVSYDIPDRILDGYGINENLIKKAYDDGKLLKDIMPGDLLKFGLIPEFVGRLPVVVTLESLDRDALINILTMPKNALVKQYKKLFEMDNVQLDFSDEALNAIADEAIKRKTGARGLRSIIEEIMRDIMFDIPSNYKITKCTITGETVREKKAPEIEIDENKERIVHKTIKKEKSKSGKKQETA